MSPAKLALEIGAMKNLGFAISRSTVATILAEHGLDPAPKRGRSMTWGEFLRAHWDGLAAADFFTVEALTAVGLVRLQVLFVVELRTRIVHVAGIVHQPHGAWMMQIGATSLTRPTAFLLGKTHLILDRDPVFTDQFRRLLRVSDTTDDPVVSK